MTKFNKSLLTAAVVGALALPGMVAASTLSYPAGKQITFAKDLIVNDGTTIYVPADLTLKATTDDATRIATVTGGTNVTVKVTLTNGAKFDSTADAATLVAGFLVGSELGGAVGGTALTVVGTPYYSATGQELNFTFTAPTGAVGNVGGAADFALKLNSMQVTNLVEGLFAGSSVSAQITAQNSVGQQILAAKSEIAKSVWGLAITSAPTTTPALTIDVAGGGTGATAFARKTRFSPLGTVGGAAVAAPANNLFSPGSINIDIAKAAPTGTGAATYINNFSAVAANPQYNVVSTAVFSINVNGSDLTAFAPAAAAGSAANIFLDSSAACTGTGAAVIGGTVTGGTAAFSAGANHPLFVNVTNASPSATSLFVCMRANGAREMVAQSLSADVSVNYQLNTQRVNPPAVKVALSPLQLNGTEILFQNVNPAGNLTAQSFIRVTNNNADVCPITIDAKDDAGRHSGEVKFVLGAHESKQVNSEVLEGKAAAAGVTGSFGDGTGKWYVRVTAECANVAGSALNRHQDGVVTDLTPAKSETWLTPTTKL